MTPNVTPITLEPAPAPPASPNAPSRAPDEPAGGSTAPLAVWLAVQLGAVLVVVQRVPLAAQYPEPAEQMAAYVVTGAQVVGAALLFPLLLRSRRSTVEVIASAWPFLLAAGYLAGMPPAALLWPAAWVTAWLLTLALWLPVLRSERLRMGGVAVASLLTLGGGAARYLRLEFAGASAEPAFAPESASPLLSTWTSLNDSTAAAGSILLGILVLAAIAFRAALAARKRSRAATPATIVT